MNFAYINFEYLRKITDNNNELILNMINSYLELTPVAIDELKDAYDTKDWDRVSALAHEIQSSAGILGIEKLRKNLKLLEEKANSQDGINEINGLMNEIYDIHNVSLIEIEQSKSTFQG